MNADKGKSIRALIDTLENIPPEQFGTGRARILRKLVLVAIAKYADPDGTNAMPSTATLARMCLVTDRAIRDTVAWLEKHSLLRVEYKAGRHGCNRYTVRLETPTPGTNVPCSPPPGTYVPGIHLERSRSNPEQFARDAEIENASLPSLDRPKDREEKAQTAHPYEGTEKISKTGTPDRTETPARDIEGRAVGVEATIRKRGVPVTAKLQQIIRRRLRQSGGWALDFAVNAVMDSMPRDERKPHFYLAQNLDAEVERMDQTAEEVRRECVEQGIMAERGLGETDPDCSVDDLPS